MAVSRTISYATVDELWLDPTNPRLGRHVASDTLLQGDVLLAMQGWALQELAASFLNSGFWPQEALIVHEEVRQGAPRLVVVEGNRRLAALKTLKTAIEDGATDASWGQLVGSTTVAPEGLFDAVPYLLVDEREDVDAYLGFRHVTGIKQWRPAEKAQYIARLLNDHRDATFRSVARDIGSKADSVRRNYAAFQLLLQLEALETDVTPQQTQERFSVLYLSLRQTDVQTFLGLTLSAGATPDDLRVPVPPAHEPDLQDFGLWLFGTPTRDPLFGDSRQVGDFARILASEEAVDYLRSTAHPQMEMALRKSNADLQDVLTAIRQATDHVESALAQVHLVRHELEVKAAVERFDKSARELVNRTRASDQQSS